MNETPDGWTPSLGKIKKESEDNDQQNIQKSDREKDIKTETVGDKCSICWSDPPTNAILLKCNHPFCFLCIKSVATATGKCPLCRADIDLDLEYGVFNVVGDLKLPISHDGYYWFYEGKTGWWLYDAETSKELESAYRDERKSIERLIAGNVYVINLTKLKQYQKSDGSKSRKICRSTLDLNKILGVAGLRDKRPLTR